MMRSFLLSLAALATVVGCSVATDDSSSSEQDLGLFPVTTQQVNDARRSGDPTTIAGLFHTLAQDRTALPWNNAQLRLDRTHQLLDGLDVAEVAAVRAAYIRANGEDPEITIRSDALGKTILRLDRSMELEMVGALVTAPMAERASTLEDMLVRSRRGALSADDRTHYFAMLPMMGLWDAPVRAAAGDRSLDALERTLFERAWTAEGEAMSLDDALLAVEAKLPEADPTPTVPRERAIAVIASSHGAQWQELMDWSMVLDARGYSLQVFSAEGRPIAFQRDSLSVSTKTVALGFGAPKSLDPAGPAGVVAAKVLGRTAPASSFDATKFGAVYLAGGLGFNEDVAVARAGADRSTVLTANPNIAALMRGAVAEKLPIIALCHGPTLLAAVPGPDGSPLANGLSTASLPPFESFVGLTGRKEIQFTYDVNTHHALEAAGAHTNVVADIADMHRVVASGKDGIEVFTGPGPQASFNLATPTMESMQRKWGR